MDAKLITGVYEYVVGALPWPFKLMIGFAGITGSKATGLAMLRDDANRGVLTSVDAKNGDRAVSAPRRRSTTKPFRWWMQLKNEYPHDFLFCLEEANLRKDAGEGMRAVEAYRQIQADNAKPGYFAEARMELAGLWIGRRAARPAA